MNFPGCLVIETPRDWQIIVADQSEQLSMDVQPDELPICVNLMIGLAKLKSPTVVLAPASTSCYFCLLKSSEIVDARDRQAMLFELENHLPIDAESMVADFVAVSSGDQPAVSAVAIDTDRWRRIVDAFERADLPVRSIVPSAVLATRALSQQVHLGETTELFLADEDELDVIDLRGDAMLGWKHLAREPAAIRRHQVLKETEADATVVVGLDPDQYSELTGSDADFIDQDRETLIARGAELLLETPSARWFELRRGALAPSDPLRAIGRQLRWVAVAAAACLLALAVGGWWRKHRIEQEIENVRIAQTDAFREAFPDSRMPGAVLRRVRSEHSKVLNSRGENTDIEVPDSAPDTLRRLLAAIPDGVRYRVMRIEIRNGEVNLLLQVKNTVDAGRIASAIAEAGFRVDPPGTRRIDAQTFESDLKASWKDPVAEMEASS